MSRYYTRINDVEFDHVFTIMSGGTITDGPAGIHAPESVDGELSDPDWEYFTHGYTGQYGYRGPIMHASEYIGGRLERDMLSDPGIYASVVDTFADAGELSDEDVPEDFPVRPVHGDTGNPNVARCGTCGLAWDDSVSTSLTPVPAGRCPFEPFHTDGEDDAAGWAVVRYTGKLPTRGRYIGVWHGGHSYAHGEWTDAEWFGTIADAVEAIRQRRAGWFVGDYVMRGPDDTRCPCAHDEWSGSIMLYRIPDGMTPDDVEYMIGTGYPDRCIRFGPRGGLRVERT